MEKTDEVYGDGDEYTTEFREYDPRVGRWFSRDPMMAYFADQSPYNFCFNNPINLIDPFGLAGSKSGGGSGGSSSQGSTVAAKPKTKGGYGWYKNGIGEHKWFKEVPTVGGWVLQNTYAGWKPPRSPKLIESGTFRVNSLINKHRDLGTTTINNNRYVGSDYKGNVPFNGKIIDVTNNVVSVFDIDRTGTARGNVVNGLKLSGYWDRVNDQAYLPDERRDMAWPTNLTPPDENGDFTLTLDPSDDAKYLDYNNYPQNEISSYHTPENSQTITVVFEYEIYKQGKVSYYRINGGELKPGGKPEIIKELLKLGFFNFLFTEKK